MSLKAEAQPIVQPAEPMERPPATAPLRPFTAFASLAVGQLPHVKQMYQISRGTAPGIAAQVTSRMFEGTRVVLAADFANALCEDPRDVCMTLDGKPTGVGGIWPVHGARSVAEYTDNWFRSFAAVGGKMDFMVLDYERENSNWDFNDEQLKIIGQDPRFPELTKELGFNDISLVNFLKGHKGEYLRWNAVMDRHLTDAMEIAITIPVRRNCPRTGISNFNRYAMPPENVVPDLNGHLQYKLGQPMGTHQSPSLYGGCTPRSVIDADWTKPFMQVVYASNLIRACRRSSPRGIIPWFGYRGWIDPGGRSLVWGGTDYYQEGIYQSLLSGGTSNLLFFNPETPNLRPGDKLPRNAHTPRDNDVLEEVMADLEKQAKSRQIVATVTAEPVAWDGKTVVSAAKLADGSVIARVTFAEDLTEATVTVDGKPYKVTKPAGQVGVWVNMK